MDLISEQRLYYPTKAEEMDTFMASSNICLCYLPVNKVTYIVIYL